MSKHVIPALSLFLLFIAADGLVLILVVLAVPGIIVIDPEAIHDPILAPDQGWLSCLKNPLVCPTILATRGAVLPLCTRLACVAGQDWL